MSVHRSGAAGPVLVRRIASRQRAGIGTHRANSSGMPFDDPTCTSWHASLRLGFAVPMILVLGIIPLAPAFAPRVAASLRRG